ncbi:MAG: hypothetical protein IT580_17475 [Verrucomicrobiales bacterium]|nr:hypothetical protein [Verrucomicrobiales bacterium]
MNAFGRTVLLAGWLLGGGSIMAAVMPLVTHDNPWAYHKGTQAPAVDWKTVPEEALDTSWLHGRGGFGYADSAAETDRCLTLLPDMKGGYTTLYARQTFRLAEALDSTQRLVLTVDWDDGFVAWLDGRFLVGVNHASGTNEPAFTSTASSTHEHSLSTDDTPSAPVAYDLGPARLGAGDHVLALMGLNGSRSSRDFVLLADLAVGPAETPVLIDGVADRQYGAHVDRVRFRVPTQRGFRYLAHLDGQRVPTDIDQVVTVVDYHELLVTRTHLASGETTNALVRFIVRSSERSAKQSTEDGLPPWTPWPPIPSSRAELAGASFRLLRPRSFPAGYDIPVVVWVQDSRERVMRVNGDLTADAQPTLAIKRGVGSGFLHRSASGESLVHRAEMGGLPVSLTVALDGGEAWTAVSGTLPRNTSWPPGARIAVTNDLTIPAGGTLEVGAGTVVRLDPGVNLFADGLMDVQGSVEDPVVFMPSERGRPWGGFFLREATSEIRAVGTLFTGSGADPQGTPGSHRVEQSLFHCTSHGRVTLTDSAAIALSGQLGHSVGMDGTARYFFTLERFLMQGAITGGEYEDAVFQVRDSAFIDCFEPAVPYWRFQDADEDGLYLKNIPAGHVSGFTNTLFGWTRDDGVDSGASGGGTLRFQNCWFESVYHEANSLSGQGKDVRHTGDVFLGCGQAIECGYGAPTGRVDRCLMLSGNIGVRFGDNYDWTYAGSISATQCVILNNHHDVWGMNWQDWTYRAGAMDIRSNELSSIPAQHPANRVWDPATVCDTRV